MGSNLNVQDLLRKETEARKVSELPRAPPDSGKLDPSELILPAFVLLRRMGVFINLSPPPAQDLFQLFVDRLFSGGYRFAGLDYAAFIRLLYGDDSVASPRSDANEVRLANSIVRFPPQRMALYKDARIANNGERAEYMFGPLFIEAVEDEPVRGEPGGDWIIAVVKTRHSIEKQTTQLDFDEFIASMWTKGVRLGIDANVVRSAIKEGASTRINFASQLEPTDSRDAEIVEESHTLHQDNAPLILSSGKADLHRARNRFPQVAKDTPLLRKIPRALGKPGYRVNGTVIAPRAPLDIDLVKLAGEGTRIVQSKKGEMLVANIDGFVVVDEATGNIFITTKIENKGGISAKSTGDIRLTVEDYLEHGEVQEGRFVEGKHMTFRSDVYGTVISQGGNIELDKNLSGGRAQSIGGNITVSGKTINATLEAWDGKVSAEFAEESLIMGKNVVIEHAVNCEIIADELHLGIAEGCAIAGRKLQITSSNARKNRETIISILLPDIASYDRQISEAKKSLVQIENALQAKNREIAATQSDPGFAKYLAIADKVRAGTIKFSPEQQVGWQKIVNQFAPILRGTDGLMKKCMILEDAIEHWTQERKACAAGGEYCRIEEVLGDTVVRKLSSTPGLPAFRDMPRQELRSKLQEFGDAQERIFSDHNGTLDWHFTVPDSPTLT